MLRIEAKMTGFGRKESLINEKVILCELALGIEAVGTALDSHCAGSDRAERSKLLFAT